MLENELVRLRAVESTDLERWRAWVNDPEIAGFLDRILPVSDYEHQDFFKRMVLENRSAVWFAIEDASAHTYIGNVWLWGIDSRHRHAEVRILIGDRDYWSGGYGTAALRAISAFAFEKAGLHKVFAYVMARNPRARRAFHKAGFIDEATLREEVYWDGEFQDVWRVYQTHED